MLLSGGNSMPIRKTVSQRFALWCGYKLATRNKDTSIHKTCSISPEAHISPRNGSIEIGPRSSVALGAIIQGNVKIGENSSVQAYSILVGFGGKEDPTGLIQIGNSVRIASHVMMIAGNHKFEDTNRPISGQGLNCKPIIIEDDVWIAGNVNIVAGVTVGRGSVIGAGSVVTKDIPPYSVAVGSPARVIKNRLSTKQE